jgi:hypothetical protein
MIGSVSNTLPMKVRNKDVMTIADDIVSYH